MEKIRQKEIQGIEIKMLEFYFKSNINVLWISHKHIIFINPFQIDGMDGISANGALAYDAVQILDAAFKKILKDKPNPFKNDRQIGTNIHYVILFMAFSIIIIAQCHFGSMYYSV